MPYGESIATLLTHSDISLLRHSMTALCGARHPHVLPCTFRCLRSARLVLIRLATTSDAVYDPIDSCHRKGKTHVYVLHVYVLKELPQPHVDFALGFFIENPALCK